MNCPSCRGAMEALSLQTHIGLPVTIDACWSCHLIWFDNQESSSLSPGSVIELFKRIHSERDTARNLVGMQLSCPSCTGKLSATSDLARGGRFSYYRCEKGHGRLIAFTQFLREKNFIRSLQQYEITALAVTVKQVRCSSCGAPINIEKDSACTHCGSPVSVLDEAAVEKALTALQAREVQRTTWDPARMNEILTAQKAASPRASSSGVNMHETWLLDVGNSGGLADLVEIGISAALSAWLD
ncbi:MAG: zf-TFIIB domain-containing protein [Betaproteobacteria bacterium]